MKGGLRIIVAGSGRLGLAVLMPLLDSHHQVVGIIQNGRRVPRWHRLLLPWQYRLMPSLPSPMREAIHRRIPVRWLEILNEKEINALKKMKPDLIITCGFSIILPPEILDLPAIGCINVHTASLPFHRGANPCAYAILNNDKESGVTFHVTETGIDTGSILAQDAFTIEPTNTSMDVYLTSCALTEAMTLEAINEIELNGFAHAKPQPLNTGSYDPPFSENLSEIDWAQPAQDIDRVIRAALAYGPAWFKHRGQQVRVAGASFDPAPVQAPPGTVLHTKPRVEVATGKGTVTLLSAYTRRLGGTRWPATFSGLKPGTQLK